MHEPRAVIYHHMDCSRQTRGYFPHCCYADGFSKVRAAQLSEISASLSSERTYVIHVVRRSLNRGFTACWRTGGKDVLSWLIALLLGVSWTTTGHPRATVSRIGFPLAGKR